MIFAWDAYNKAHIAKHGVSPSEAEQVVRNAVAPYPMELGDEKLVIWGATRTGRYLQVIYSLKAPDDITFDSLTIEQWMSVEADEVIEIIRVIHAMDLTPAMKKQLRRRRR